MGNTDSVPPNSMLAPPPPVVKSFAIIAGDFVCTGGMDRANYALASYLADAENHVELVAHRIAPDLASRANLIMHQVAKPFGSYFIGQRILRQQGFRIGSTVAARGGRVISNGGNCEFPDVNWVHYLHAAYRPQNASSPLRRLKAMIQHPQNLREERRALESARLIVCNSERTRRDVVEYIGVGVNRTRVIYYGIDSQRFFPVSPAVRSDLRHRLGLSPKRPLILFVGALGDRRKGFDTLFDAWRILCRTPTWDAELLVVGCGAEVPIWIRRADAALLHNRIRFLGFRTDVAELLQAADALVSPTRYEAYGLGVHEALCCGVPAFVSKDAGVAEQYPQELHDLLLPEPNDSEDLAARLLRWRLNPTEWRERIQPLSDRLRRHTWDAMARQLLAAVEEGPA